MACTRPLQRLLQLGLTFLYPALGRAALTRGGHKFLGQALDHHIPTEREMKAVYALDAIYKGQASRVSETDSQEDRAHRDVYNASGDGSASVYGEIQPSAVLDMLRITGMKEGQKFYDLGCGYGKTVVLAWLLGLNATGVELAQDRWQGSCDALHRAPEIGVSGHGNGVNFVRASFFDVDFSDADLVFMNSVMFSDETMEGLAKVARRLRPGSKIVSSHMGLPGPGFKKLGTLNGDVSWTHRQSRWTIQQVITSVADASAEHPAKRHGEQAQICTL